MASAKDTPPPAQPNLQAVLAIAVDRNGPDNRANAALQQQRGEEPGTASVPRSAAT